MPQQNDDEMLSKKKEAVSTRLKDCLKIDDRGQLELKLKLPNQAALDSIAATLAKLIK